MSATVRTSMTLAAFLAWEERQKTKFEFDGTGPVAMTGVTAAHSAIQRNLLYVLTGRLRGTRCQPHGSELKIEVAGHIRYPDAFVVCTRVEPGATVVTEPVVVFEIVSENSVHRDFVVKNTEYRATPSVQRYVVLQQTHAGAVMFARRGEDWLAEIISGDRVLRMPEIDVEFALDELYSDVDLDQADDE